MAQVPNLSSFSPQFSKQFGDGWASLDPTNSLSATITGLKPATTYDIRVVAFNAAGVKMSAPLVVSN